MIINYIPHSLHFIILHYLFILFIVHLNYPPLPLLVYRFFFSYFRFLVIHSHQSHQIRLTLKMGVPAHHHILVSHLFNQLIRPFHPQIHCYRSHNHMSHIRYRLNNHMMNLKLCQIFQVFMIPLIDLIFMNLLTDRYLILHFILLTILFYHLISYL